MHAQRSQPNPHGSPSGVRPSFQNKPVLFLSRPESVRRRSLCWVALTPRHGRPLVCPCPGVSGTRFLRLQGRHSECLGPILWDPGWENCGLWLQRTRKFRLGAAQGLIGQHPPQDRHVKVGVSSCLNPQSGRSWELGGPFCFVHLFAVLVSAGGGLVAVNARYPSVTMETPCWPPAEAVDWVPRAEVLY